MAIDTANAPLTPLQNALYLLKETQAKLAAQQQARSEPIAVIGLGCRFPEANNPAEYWRLLENGTDAIQEVPSDRWNLDEYYDSDNSIPGKMYTRWGGFLDRMDEFDADFFGISPREAIRVDPQQRLLMEVAWEALEHAGIPPASLSESRTGVYVGVIGNDYALLQSRDLTDMDVFSGTGVSHAVLANRISYVLDLHGPSLALDTACSSSLVTVHLACRSLREGESDLALAGGVNLLLSPATTIALSKAQMMAPDGRCKAFDAAADGYVRGEGCGMIVLKRLRDAVAAGDRILALIRGSAVNHDGRSNGLSAPNGPAQEAVLHAALRDAGLSPRDIGYIEAHGTGTRLGDPIEIEALRSVFCQNRSLSSPLMLGSVKTNIGHLESAAGIAGLIKLILMLEHRQVPPHLHLKNPNPLLGIKDSPLVIPTRLTDWTSESGPRRAGVSSFGFGGTNAHVILEEPPTPEASANAAPDAPQRPQHVWTASARSAEALNQLAAGYAEHLAAGSDSELANLAFTANSGRMHFTHRAAVVASSVDEARKKFEAVAADPLPAGVRRGVVEHHYQPRIAFLFTGQGAQYAGMGCALYETQPTFRRAIDRCAACLDGILDRPLLSLLDAQASQTGLIVVGLHMGNFDLIMQVAARLAREQANLRGLVLSFPEPGKGYQLQNKLRQLGNLEVIPASLAAIRKAEQWLAGGGVVLSGLDRPLADMKYRPHFFGRPASLPVLHVPLALRSKAPVLVAAVLLQPDKTYQLMISDLYTMKEYSDHQKEILVNAETLLEAAENFVRRSPQQWSMYYPVWPEAMAEMES